eukprot:10395330-Alexandrium_andersonii.AAC.1
MGYSKGGRQSWDWQKGRTVRRYICCPHYGTCGGWVWEDRRKQCCERCGAAYGAKSTGKGKGIGGKKHSEKMELEQAAPPE